MDEKKRTIVGRDGATIDLSNTAVAWHIFIVYFRARGTKVSPANLREGYPGEWGEDAGGSMRVQKHKLNKRLAKFGLRIAEGALGAVAGSGPAGNGTVNAR